ITGVRILDASNNSVQGNRIGTNAAGDTALGNQNGVVIQANPTVIATANAIGGPAPGAGNVISGNATDGVRIAGSGATGNTVAGNLIGVNAADIVALGNDAHGLVVTDNAHDNTIGGTSVSYRNVISGNRGPGVLVTGG